MVGKSVGKVGKVEKPEMSRQLLRDWYQFVYQKPWRSILARIW